MAQAIARGRDKQALAAIAVMAHADADVLLVLDVDWDLEGRGVASLLSALENAGLTYAHHIALKPNSGVPSGHDLDGNGRLGEARDALGYGRFTGDGGMVLLSRFPLVDTADHSVRLWADVDGSAAPQVLGDEALAIVPLATTAQWVVQTQINGTIVELITMNAGTPVFDGPEDRNGLRNQDELSFVRHLVDAAALPLVLGRSNIDPADGEGHRDAMAALLAHPDLQDPKPRGHQGGGTGHVGDDALDTANWAGPGPLRVDYVLPARAMRVLDAGVIWPAPDDHLAETVEQVGSGRLVWVDIALP